MAITILSEGPKVGFARNKIIYQLATDNFKEDVGEYAVYRLEVVTIPETGDTIPLVWDSLNVAMEAEFVSSIEAAADTTGMKIRDDQTSKLNVATVIKLKLEQNALIDEAYTLTIVEVSGDYFVEFTAKNVGLKFNLVTGLEDDWCSWTQETSGGDEVYDGEFYLVTKIQYLNGSEYSLLGEILSKPLLDQTVEIDVAELLRSVVDSYHLPEIGQTEEIKLTNITKDYRLLFFEKKPAFLGSLQPGPQITGKTVVHGGLSKDHFAQYPDAFVNWFADGQRFLTWFPNGQEVREDQDHFISFLNYDESTDVGAGS